VPVRKELEAASYEAGIRGFASCEKRVLVQKIPRPKAKSALGYMRTSLTDSPANRSTPRGSFPEGHEQRADQQTRSYAKGLNFTN